MAIFHIRSGVNQNDAATYSIIKLYFEQADEQPREQANEQADEHIITILDLYYIYIINKSANFGNISEADKTAIILLLKKLEMYPDNLEIFKYYSEEALLDLKIQYWAIKELYFSPHRVYLSKMKREDFIFRFLKAKKYVSTAETTHFINYFIKSLQEEFYCSQNKK